ncbi:DUF3265 domain-containing protein, partial [Vibrio toranzoniae]|nr:DUF3265 domain-containing protein [Vibrio toranzoniae]
MALNLWLHRGGKLTKRLRQIRNAWHFYYALIYVFKVLCGGFVLRCSLLSLALVCKEQKSVCGLKALFYVLAIHLSVFQSHELSGGTMLEAFA